MKELTINVDGLTDEQISYIEQVIQDLKRRAGAREFLKNLDDNNIISEKDAMELALEGQKWARKQIRQRK